MFLSKREKIIKRSFIEVPPKLLEEINDWVIETYAGLCLGKIDYNTAPHDLLKELLKDSSKELFFDAEPSREFPVDLTDWKYNISASSENLPKKWKIINVKFVPIAPYTASYNFITKTITINGYNYDAKNLSHYLKMRAWFKQSIIHELQHFAQDLITHLEKLNKWFGFPSTKSKSKGNNRESESEHDLLDAEFQTVLADSVEFLRKLFIEKIPKGDRISLLKYVFRTIPLSEVKNYNKKVEKIKIFELLKQKIEKRKGELEEFKQRYVDKPDSEFFNNALNLSQEYYYHAKNKYKEAMKKVYSALSDLL